MKRPRATGQCVIPSAAGGKWRERGQGGGTLDW